MRRFALVLLALAGGVALALGPASPAHAHATLESSVPAGSSVLDTAPTDITLDFDEPVTVEPGAIRLLDSGGKEITLGLPERGTDASIVVSSVPDLKDGAYVVAWQVISQDGHPASGAFTFQVGRAGATDTRGLLASVLNQQRGDRAVQQLATFNRLLTYTGLALTLGGAVFAVAIWPSASRRWAARRLIWFGWGLLLLATISTLVVAGPYLTGRSLHDVLNLDVTRSIAGTRVFRMAEVRLLLVLLGLPLLLRLRRGLSPNAQLAGVLLGELTIGTVALAGHSGSGRWAGVGVILDAVHLGAMAVWLGGLALLVVMLAAPSRTDDDSSDDGAAGRVDDRDDAIEDLDDGRAAEDAAPSLSPSLSPGSVGAAVAPVDERTEAVDRFSSVAFGCVVALVVTGVVQAWRILPGGLSDLTSTDYGRILLVKVAFVAGLVALGWGSRRLLRRRRLGQPLWRSVATEVVVAVAVLAVTAVLTGHSPAEGTSSSRTVSATLVQGDLLADVSVIPARKGPNEIHLTFSPPGGTLDAVKNATARMTLPSRGDIGPIPIQLTPAGPNHYIGSGVQIPYDGKWRLDIVATDAQDATVLMSTTIDVKD
ncbi:MAG TPA: copper resistance protein CopC [Acidimicrobiales bacterium]